MSDTIELYVLKGKYGPAKRSLEYAGKFPYKGSLTNGKEFEIEVQRGSSDVADSLYTGDFVYLTINGLEIYGKIAFTIESLPDPVVYRFTVNKLQVQRSPHENTLSLNPSSGKFDLVQSLDGSTKRVLSKNQEEKSDSHLDKVIETLVHIEYQMEQERDGKLRNAKRVEELVDKLELRFSTLMKEISNLMERFEEVDNLKSKVTALEGQVKDLSENYIPDLSQELSDAHQS